MQVFVREHCTVIAAPIQCDVDGIAKGSHYVRVPIVIKSPRRGSTEKIAGSWRIPARARRGYLIMRSSAIGPPALAPNTTAGSSPRAWTMPAASSACSATEVVVQPFGRSRREPPARPLLREEPLLMGDPERQE